MKSLLLTLLLPAAALSLPSHPQPGYAPKLYCRPTNTSIYAEVCVPGIDADTEQVGLNVKRVADDQFCYTKSSTECREETRLVSRQICTYEYEQRKVKAGATTVQVTYETKSETMKVTTCRPEPQYGYPQPPKHGHESSGSLQKCREEYQTQTYNLPKVDTPQEIAVDIAFPEPVQRCQNVEIEVAETVCDDVAQEVCIDLAKLEDDRQYIDQTVPVLGQPDCNKVTLTLPTEVCSKGYHKQ